MSFMTEKPPCKKTKKNNKKKTNKKTKNNKHLHDTWYNANKRYFLNKVIKKLNTPKAIERLNENFLVSWYHDVPRKMWHPMCFKDRNN